MSIHPIRRYIAWVLTGAVSLVVVLFAVIVFTANESLEQQYHQRMVQTERAHVLRVYRDSGARSFDSALAMSYLVDPQTHQPAPPAWLATYGPGDYEIEDLGERDYFISVEDLAEGRLYIAIDNTGPEEEEEIFDLTILISALLLVALSVQASLVLSRRLAGPLSRLAEDVQRFDPAARGQRLPVQGGTRETQRIAEVFNTYAQRLDEFIEREQNLTAMASHELRTPLATVSGAAEILEQRLAGDEANRRTLARIRDAAQEMRDSIEAILELSRSVEGAAPRRCRADEILVALIEQHAASVTARGLRMPSRLVPVTLPAHPQLVQILAGNLIGNALRHTTRGEIRVELDEQGLAVSDTGSGIAAEDLPRLMQPGERGRESPGAGLGLYIARKVCERYGWRLSLTVRPEGGTVARVDFTAATDGQILD